MGTPLAAFREVDYMTRVIQSRLDARCRIVVPAAVLAALGAVPGDRLAYEIKDGQVVVRRRPQQASATKRTLLV